jgi:hypothetical protein
LVKPYIPQEDSKNNKMLFTVEKELKIYRIHKYCIWAK